MARSVVAGKCVNGYSKKDWVLALRYNLSVLIHLFCRMPLMWLFQFSQAARLVNEQTFALIQHFKHVLSNFLILVVSGSSYIDVLIRSFRAQQGTFRPASGLGPIPVAGIENVDLTDIVNGHGDYVKNIDGILARLGLAHTAI